MWILLLFAAQIFSVHSEATDCPSTDKCIQDIEGELENFLISFTQQSSVLDAHCQSMKTDTKCLFDISEKECKENKFIAGLSSSLKKYYKQLCDPASDSRKTYADTSACFVKYKEAFESCHPDKPPADAKKAQFKELCKEWSTFKPCLIDTAHVKCSDKGKEMMKMVMEPFAEIRAEQCGEGHRFSAYLTLIITALLLSLFKK